MTPRVPSWACLIYMLQLEGECLIVYWALGPLIFSSHLLLYKDLCTLIFIYNSIYIQYIYNIYIYIVMSEFYYRCTNLSYYGILK